MQLPRPENLGVLKYPSQERLLYYIQDKTMRQWNDKLGVNDHIPLKIEESDCTGSSLESMWKCCHNVMDISDKGL